MRPAILAALAAAAIFAQSHAPDPYSALRARDYDTAVPAFLQAIEAAPARADLRKDLAYTYLKTGEPVLARDQFSEALRLDPADSNAALEYAFLCFETGRQAEARRVFNRLRPNPTAETAFRNIDGPLAAGIARWQAAIAGGADNFSAHFELAALAEQRDELDLAATHYERAWRIRPASRNVLVDLGRVWKAAGQIERASAALLSAAYGGEPRAAEQARELLPAHYPFVADFRRALAFDPANHEMRRELAYLLLRLQREREAEAEFRLLTQNAPEDLLSATQLGFILFARCERLAAQPLFDRVLAGKDDELANRVRAVLHLPQVAKPRAAAGTPTSIDDKVMAARSFKAGYMKDALKYLEAAHESDPGDFAVMLQLAWTNNLLHRDLTALRWFDLARRSPDPKVAADGDRGYRSLRSLGERFRTSAWLFPVFSTRWHDVFSYGQVKAELNTGIPLRPYISTRFVGDSRFTNLSESSVIFALGVATEPRRGVHGWFEAGTALNYRTVHALPDYRGGIHFTRRLPYTQTELDAIYVSRFDHDFLIYSQTRAGLPNVYWNFNLTIDAKQEDWANFVETGPGIRIPLPQSMYLTFNALRGRYLIDNGSRRPAFNDLRTGLWYSFTR